MRRGPYGWFHPYWGQFTGPREFVCWRAEAEGNRASFEIVTERQGQPIRSDWRMVITYDVELRSYAYHVTATATVLDEPDAASYNPYKWKYFDLFPEVLFDAKTGPSLYRDGQPVEFLPPRWGCIAYERHDLGDSFGGLRTWLEVPLNRCIASATSGTEYCRLADPALRRAPVRAGRRHRLSVYVRSDDLDGPGAKLGCFLGGEEKSCALCRERLNDTLDLEAARRVGPTFGAAWVRARSDWMKIELIMRPTEERPAGTILGYELGVCLLQPVLWHEGRGASWFDDFVMEELE